MKRIPKNIALSVPVPGWVTAVYAHAGDHVKAGERLFSLDDRDLRAELEVEKARLIQARANVQAAKASLADAVEDDDEHEVDFGCGCATR